MKIEVIGSGCTKCTDLYERITHLVEQKKLTAEVVHVTDANELIERGILGSPAVVVDGVVVLIGSLASDDELYRLITSR